MFQFSLLNKRIILNGCHIGWLSHFKVELSEGQRLKTWARFFDEKEPVYCAVAMEVKRYWVCSLSFHRSTWAESDFVI